MGAATLRIQILTLGGIDLASSNVGFVKYWHIKRCRTAFLHLRNIFKVGNILSQSGAEKVAHGFITSRLDNCCSLLSSSCPKNCSKGTNREREHVSLILAFLHWLPVKSNISK